MLYVAHPVDAILFGLGILVTVLLLFLLVLQVAMLVVFLSERFPLTMDESRDESVPRSPTMAALVAEAEALSFQQVAVLRLVKAREVRTEIWLSPERDVVLNVVSGVMMKMRIETCQLYSLLPGDRALMTTNAVKSLERDISDSLDEKLLVGVNLGNLLVVHRERFWRRDRRVVPFAENPLDDMRRLYRARVRRLIETGLARLSGDNWRYTLKGAIRSVVKANTASNAALAV